MNRTTEINEVVHHDVLGDITGFKGAIKIELHKDHAMVKLDTTELKLEEKVDYILNPGYDDKHRHAMKYNDQLPIHFQHRVGDTARNLIEQWREMSMVKKAHEFDNRNGIERATERLDDDSTDTKSND